MSSSWIVESLPRPCRASFEAPGDVQVSLAALAAASLASQPVTVWGVPECEPVISLRRGLAQLGVQFVAPRSGCLQVLPAPHEGQPASEVFLDCGKDASVPLLLAGLMLGRQHAVRLLHRNGSPGTPFLLQAVELLAHFGRRAQLEQTQAGTELSIEAGRSRSAEIELGTQQRLCKALAVLACSQLEGSSLLDNVVSADHMERALSALGFRPQRRGRTLSFASAQTARGRLLKVPPDCTAAMPLALACGAIPGSRLELPILGMNPVRSAYLRSIQRCGVMVQRERDWQFGSEPVSSLVISAAGQGRAGQIPPNAAPAVFDDIGALAVFFSQCRGHSRLCGLEVLRECSPDRLVLACQLLRDFGAEVELHSDRIELRGPVTLHCAEVNCADDRMLGLLGVTAALLADGPSRLHGMSALDSSWPGLHRQLAALAMLQPPDET